MTYTTDLREFLTTVEPFNQLSSTRLVKLLEKARLQRYRMGQPILVRDKLPTCIVILCQGQVRLLGYESPNQSPITLQRLEPGEIAGWAGLVRGVACETVIASTEAVCLNLPALDFLTLLKQEASIATYFHYQPALIEIFDLLAAKLQQHPNSDMILQSAGVRDLKELSLKVYPQAIAHYLCSPSHQSLDEHQDDRLWFVSGGDTTSNLEIGSPFNHQEFSAHHAEILRLIGIPADLLTPSTPKVALPPAIDFSDEDISYAEESQFEERNPGNRRTKQQPYPFVCGKGGVNTAVACFQMLAQHLNLPFRRDSIQTVLTQQQARTGSLSLLLCGAVAEMIGLRAQLVEIPATAINRIQTPALIRWQESFAVLYEANGRTLILGVPEIGIVHRSIEDLVIPDFENTSASDRHSTSLQVLLLQPHQHTPKQTFGLTWFLPFVSQYRCVLIEVLIASLFVQLFGLANPLMTQIIIDKVLVQNSPNTLQILGIFLIVIATFEAILTSLRTYLFADTTNRIDLALGSEIIHHLLRLPLRYFDRRPVGELATRINELENIRQFLTTTALTSVMDAVFSIIYIIVMFIYSWQLALVALATLPLFVLLTTLVSPLVRRQLRTKAEHNAKAQSYLVEVLSGIQTVKAQNIELRSRWQWQERYAHYVSAGFKTILTSTAASSTSNFLNELSSLLVIWVGAYFVLQNTLTLGQLIAFRIIANYVTSPLLRLTQLWQNFQQTALSLERLGDIIDTPAEADDHDRHNIPLPAIQGTVKYENVSFRFNPSGPLQLNNLNIEFPIGAFVGIVGQSGSGKSTMMKLLPRLYPLESGRILVDGYDISKVELYSLRRQVGIVPQEPLLFEGTVRENIALNHPDAASEEIIAAAKVAAAHDFIMSLPNGYNTLVGERGSALSGGQRQRIAIARTVLQNPRLLILDEATSALDYESERQVCLNLAKTFHHQTVFFITHRISTIRSADVIVMMDHGSIVETGTHEVLMALKGYYYCLYRQQEVAK